MTFLKWFFSRLVFVTIILAVMFGFAYVIQLSRMVLAIVLIAFVITMLYMLIDMARESYNRYKKSGSAGRIKGTSLREIYKGFRDAQKRDREAS